MKTVMGETHGAGFVFLYTTLKHVPFKGGTINIIFITFFLFSEDPKELNTTSPANPNTVQKEGKVTTRTCCFVLFCFVFLRSKMQID